jgi:putative peptide zinc metalloprotease protein
LPVGKVIAHVTTGAGLRRQRKRALWVSGAILAGLVFLLFVLPVPSWTRTEGVIWVPEESQVRAGVDGFIEDTLVPVDGLVERGQPLFKAEEPFLETRVAVFSAQVEELAARYDALLPFDRVQAAMVREQLVAAEANLRRAVERQAELVFRSPANGRFVVPNAVDLPGRFVSKGQLVGYVVEPREITARVALLQEDIALVRQSTRSVEVMLSFWGAAPVMAKVRREVPGASSKLPTAALGSTGGGSIAVDPRDKQGITTLRQVFQLELTMPGEVRSDYLGARIYVRFNHGFEPAGFQAYRAFRRLLLRQFNV